MTKNQNLKAELLKKQKFISIFHNRLMAWLVLCVSLILTATAYFVSKTIVEEKRSEQFLFRAKEIEHAIQDRLRIYEQALWGGVGLFHSSKQHTVSRKVFARYIESLNINQHWPGIQGIGFSIPVKASDLKLHEKKIQREGFPNFHIRPVGQRKQYSSIVYLEPFDWRNKRAHGYDMWSNDIRREAMTRARDEGIAATSGIITLVQETTENVQKGFLTYLPVYTTGNIPNTLKERRKNFVGWVYAPFRAGDLMKGIIGSKDKQIDFQIFDGKEQKLESLLYSSKKGKKLALLESNSKTTQIDLQGRTWTIHFYTPKDAFEGKIVGLPQIIAICGIIIDILLFYVIFSLHFVNRHAEGIAAQKTIELQENNERLEAKILERTKELEQTKKELESKVTKRTQELESKLKELETFNKVVIGREERVIELKKEVNELAQKAGLTPPYEI